MSVLSAERFACEEHRCRTEELLRPAGEVLRIPEPQQDAATALSGSGPGSVYYLVEAMVDAGILLGIPRGAALEMVIQAVCGAPTTLRESGGYPVLPREAVTSTAGTTASAVGELEKHGVTAALAAIEATRPRPRTGRARVAGSWGSWAALWVARFRWSGMMRSRPTTSGPGIRSPRSVSSSPWRSPANLACLMPPGCR